MSIFKHHSLFWAKSVKEAQNLTKKLKFHIHRLSPSYEDKVDISNNCGGNLGSDLYILPLDSRWHVADSTINKLDRNRYLGGG